MRPGLTLAEDNCRYRRVWIIWKSQSTDKPDYEAWVTPSFG
jgi:hypothetical protein